MWYRKRVGLMVSLLKWNLTSTYIDTSPACVLSFFSCCLGMETFFSGRFYWKTHGREDKGLGCNVIQWYIWCVTWHKWMSTVCCRLWFPRWWNKLLNVLRLSSWIAWRLIYSKTPFSPKACNTTTSLTGNWVLVKPMDKLLFCSFLVLIELY